MIADQAQKTHVHKRSAVATRVPIPLWQIGKRVAVLPQVGRVAGQPRSGAAVPAILQHEVSEDAGQRLFKHFLLFYFEWSTKNTECSDATIVGARWYTHTHRPEIAMMRLIVVLLKPQ